MSETSPAALSTFDAIIGHGRQISVLVRALERNRLAHAYLFVGSEGIGKRQVALAFTAALNCTAERAQRPCQQCANCKALGRGEHPDVSVLAPEKSTIKIDAVRELQRRLHYAALLGQYKVIIIDDAHTLGEAAANALLKTLEEPSGDTVFVLVTHSADRLLDTIHSRCQTLYFSTLDHAVIADYLSANATLAPDAATLVATMSEGSLSKALELVDGDLLTLRQAVVEAIWSAPQTSMDALFSLATEWSADKPQLIQRLDLLRLYFRDLVLLKEGAPAAMLGNVDLLTQLQRHAEQIGNELAIAHLDLVQESQTLIDRNVNPRLVVEHLLMAVKFGLQPPTLLTD